MKPTKPLRYATGPYDFEALGRERYWDSTPEQRKEHLSYMLTQSDKGNTEERKFARGWLNELQRDREVSK